MWIIIILTFVPEGFARNLARRDFTLPLNFELTDKLGKALPPKFEYAFDPDLNLKMGEKQIALRVFRLEIISGAGRDKNLKLYWPPQLMPAGELSISNDRGTEIIHKQINEEDVGLENIPEKGAQPAAAAAVWTSERIENYDLHRFPSAAWIRFCFTHEGHEFQIKYCSEPLKVVKKNGDYLVIPKPLSVETKVKINGLPVTPQGIVNFNSIDTKLVVDATLKAGATLRMESVPQKIELADAVRDGAKHILLSGTGGPPRGPNITVDSDDIWHATVDEDKPRISVFGQGDIPFIQEFVFFTDLPLAKDRPLLAKRSAFTTYARSVKLQGLAPRGYKLQTKDANLRYAANGRFAWELRDLEKTKMNRRILQLTNGEKSYTAYDEVYRSLPYEISTRLTGVATQEGQLLIFDELAGSAWFENPFGCENYWLCNRRWGVYGRYFQNLDSVDQDLQISAYSLDLKYRIFPGVWMHDPTYGLVGGFQSFSMAGVKADMFGAGVLWGRSMPQFFDEIFNIIPWFRFPKWVDAEIVYYSLTTTPGIKLGSSNFRLTFHGKMMFTPRIFLEGGFGFYNEDYVKPSPDGDDTVINLGLGFGTIGLGINF